MWRFEQPPPYALPDVKRFLDVLNRQADFFVPDEPIRVARAPGRLDLMGGIADYSGALVLELPLAAATFVAAQSVPNPYVAVQTTAAAALARCRTSRPPAARRAMMTTEETIQMTRLRFLFDFTLCLLCTR